MKFALVILSVLLSLQVVAQTDVKLPNGDLAYYGEYFHKTLRTQSTIQPSDLFTILDESHIPNAGSYDKIDLQCGASCYSHSSVGYEQARLIMFGETFKQVDGDRLFVVDVYCGKSFYYKDAREVSNMHSEINIEHTWPQSKFSKSFDKNKQKSDMHHLFPTDSDANNRRANHEFADTAGQVDQLNVENCTISQLAQMSGGMKFTPPKKHQGNVARALFYFSVRYKLPLDKTQEATMRIWNKQDPLDAEEKARHETIAKHQKVRNPFIDYPELADKILDF